VIDVTWSSGHRQYRDPQKDPDKFKNWQELWTAAQEERRNGGAYALYKALMSRDLSNFSEAKWPPMTQAKQDLIDLNMDSRERFLKEWMTDGIEDVQCMPCDRKIYMKCIALGRSAMVSHAAVRCIHFQHTLESSQPYQNRKNVFW
jgi:hypothetical protein